jgi:hypothetical protein
MSMKKPALSPERKEATSFAHIPNGGVEKKNDLFVALHVTKLVSHGHTHHRTHIHSQLPHTYTTRREKRE